MSDQQPIATPIMDAAWKAVQSSGGGNFTWEDVNILLNAGRTLERELVQKEQRAKQLLSESDSELSGLRTMLQSLQSERDKLLTTIELLERGKYGRTDMAMQILSLVEERDKLREALSISRGQWYHSVNRDQCLEALNHSKSKR